MNNPLVYTDPSGESIFLIGGIINLVRHWDDVSSKSGSFWHAAKYFTWGGLSAQNTALSFVPIHSIIPNPLIATTGSNQSSIGFNIKIKVGPFIDFNWGYTYNEYKVAADGSSSSFSQLHGGFGVQLGFVRFYSNSYITNNDFSQRLGGIQLGNDYINMAYENDGAPFDKLVPPLFVRGGKNDGYRTAALRLQCGMLSAGFNLMTGDFSSHTTISTPNKQYPNGYYEGGNVDRYRLGAAYVGFGGLRLGVNSEWIRHAIQNRWAHDNKYFPMQFLGRPQPGFLMLNKAINFYYYYGSYNPNSLW